MTGRTIVVALAAAALAAPALAADHVASAAIEEKDLASGKAKIDPAKGYIFFHGPSRLTVMLLKTPSDAERTAFESEWKDALDKAKKKYPRQLESWRQDVEFAKTHDVGKLPEKPVEPTEANFSIGELEMRMSVSIGPLYVFAKNDGDVSYLEEVEPGTYMVYGPVSVAPNGAGAGLCFCMGSVKFDVAPGKITNMGNFLAVHGDDRVVDVPTGLNPPTVENYDLPASLQSYANARADIHAAGKMNNFYGAMIGRMKAVPGVLGYQRDTVIDLKAPASDNQNPAPQ